MEGGIWYAAIVDKEQNVIAVPMSSNYSENAEKCHGDTYPCAVCGKPCPNPKWMLHLHYGGGVAILDEEFEQAEIECYGGDLGGYPIGVICLRQHPELKPYAHKQ